jgi:REP element-mobilizing transposase RayT
LGCAVLIVSVSARHAHILAHLPVQLREFNRIIGMCKNRSSRALKRELPGQVWARGDKHKLIRNRAHRKNVYLYLRDDQGPGAVAWCHQIIFD